LPFSQHKENCGLLFVDFADRSLIHIFALQNPHIMSISPQSHRPEADTSSSPNNCNASLRREGCSRCLAWRSLCRRCDVHVQILTCLELTHLCLQRIVMYHYKEKVVHVAYVVLSIGDCDLHVQILMCLDWILLEH
jgi:hypothetical protein